MAKCNNCNNESCNGIDCYYKETDIVELVKKDLDKRAAIGLKKYGERLQAHNGRDALWDAYEEVLDLANYLRQVISERK